MVFKLYGENCVNYFEGMWSFVIYNKQTNSAFYQETGLVKNLYFIIMITKNFILVQR